MLFSYRTTALTALLSASALAEQFVMYSPGGDTDSVQRIDPVISPGTISGHVHQVFGSSSVKSDMTYDSLQSTSCTSVGSASGKGNAADNSVYWHPALYAQAKDGSGLIRIPTNGHKLYYQDATNPKDQKANPFQFAKGLRMIAGNPFRRSANPDIHQQNITQWICHSKSGQNQGTDGGFPNNVEDCDAYPFFNGAITFPSCWNGADYDPLNPFAHMSYPDGDISAGPCPSTHPTRVPKIFIENQFDLHSVVDKIKPNTFVLAQGDDTGYGWHADFFNGWEDGAIPILLASCPEAFYGNEDAGICSAFKSGSATNDCKLPVQYPEEVNSPGALLPGCNPISNVDPAPMTFVAPLGSNTCAAAGGDAPPADTTTTSQEAATEAPMSASTPSAVHTTIFTLPSAYGGATTLLTTTQSQQAQGPAYSATSVTQSSSPSSSLSVDCPAANGQTYVSNGLAFTIECGVDHVAGNLGMKWVSSFSECIDKCAQTTGCVDVSLSGSACYMKKSLGAALSDGGVKGAKLASASSATSITPLAYSVPGHGTHAGNALYAFVTQVETVTAQVTAYA